MLFKLEVGSVHTEYKYNHTVITYEIKYTCYMTPDLTDTWHEKNMKHLVDAAFPEVEEAGSFGRSLNVRFVKVSSPVEDDQKNWIHTYHLDRDVPGND